MRLAGVGVTPVKPGRTREFPLSTRAVDLVGSGAEGSSYGRTVAGGDRAVGPRSRNAGCRGSRGSEADLGSGGAGRRPGPDRRRTVG